MKNTFDDDYVEALQEQAVNMAHHLQMVLTQSRGNGKMSKEIVLSGAEKAVDKYFTMLRKFDNS
jgi:hypothetical protein